METATTSRGLGQRKRPEKSAVCPHGCRLPEATPRAADDYGCHTEAMKPDDYLDHLEEDAARLITAARTEPDSNVPSCPDWDLAELVRHIGGAHRWVESMVSARSAEMLPFPKRPHEWEETASWYEEGVALLSAALREAGDDAPVWNWVAMGAGPAIFWYRRMAQETSIHRWDAENAVGEPRPIDAALAVDGIGEAIEMLAMRLAMSPEPALSGRLGLEATDASISFTLRLRPEAVDRVEGTSDADAVVRATASDLQLWLTGRRLAKGSTIATDGDQVLADALGALKFG